MPEHQRPAGRPCSHARYRLRCDDFDELLQHAKHRCQVCHRAASETGHGYLVVDHDYRVGDWAVRGLLCSSCNGSVDYPDRRTPAINAYLQHPWYERMLAARGLVATLGPEPPPGTVIRAGRRRWQRTEDFWTPLDRFGSGSVTWQQIHRRFGPHYIEIINSPHAK